MRLVDRIEPLFYGAGITATHAINESDFEIYTLWGGGKAKMFKTYCGLFPAKFRNSEYKDGNIKEVSCKNCLKKLERLIK